MSVSLIVIGSGAVGVEFASIYKSFGADVTILEMLPRYVPVEDEEVSKELMRVYRKRGINGFVNAKVETLERTKDGVAVTFTVDGKQQKLEADKVLIAVGRAPRTENVGIEKTKIEVERGFVKVDQFMRTAEPGIYAIGDETIFDQHCSSSDVLCGLNRAAGLKAKDRPGHQVGHRFRERFGSRPFGPRTSGLSPDPPWPLPARLAEPAF